MAYTLQEQYTSKNQVAGSAADSVWHKGARKVSSITIHHWGNRGQQFDTVRDFLCTNDTPTSAHYVAQDGLVACIVSPDDCAFHAGNAEGNSHSIGIECRPEATDGDYATVAELIAYLRGIYGDIPLYPHNHWYNTACPGDYDLDRLDSLARGTTIATQSATITPAKEEGFLMALTDKQQEDIYWFLCAPDGREYLAELVGGRAADKTLNTPIKRYGSGLGGETNLAGFLAWNDAHVDAIVNAVSAVAPAADLGAIKAAVQEGLAAGVNVNVSVAGSDKAAG